MNPAVAGRIDTKEDMTDTTNGTDGIGRGAPLRLAEPRSRHSAISPVFCVCKWLISRLIPANSAKFHSEKMTGARWCRVVTDSSGLRRVKLQNPNSKDTVSDFRFSGGGQMSEIGVNQGESNRIGAKKNFFGGLPKLPSPYAAGCGRDVRIFCLFNPSFLPYPLRYSQQTMPSVFIKTYGCQMNERDSEAVAAQLVAKGYTLAKSEAVADVVLLNTCSVRDMAEQKALSKMTNVIAVAKRDRPNQIFGFRGCMAQSRGK